jgi:hypothetical protein
MDAPVTPRRPPGRPSMQPGSPNRDGPLIFDCLTTALLTEGRLPRRRFTVAELASLTGTPESTIRRRRDAGLAFLDARDGAA